MLTYELNYCVDMVFVRQNQGRTTCIPILDAQSGQDGFYAIKGRCFVKTSLLDVYRCFFLLSYR